MGQENWNPQVTASEREQALRALGQHAQQGNLGSEEYMLRRALLQAARTRNEVNSIFSDLPLAIRGGDGGAVSPGSVLVIVVAVAAVAGLVMLFVVLAKAVIEVLTALVTVLGVVVMLGVLLRLVAG